MDALLNLFLEPLNFAFMQRALIGVILIGTVSGVMGAYVVTRGLSFMGDALSHSILPGVALVFISGNGGSQVALMLGGLAGGLVSALGIGWLSRGRKLQEDTAIGIVFVGMLALGIALISSTRSFATDLQHVMVGDILALGTADLWLIAITALLVLSLIIIFYKEFLVMSFDPILTETLHLPSEGLRISLIVLLSVTIVICVQGAGVLMATAMLVTPSATARLFTNRLAVMMRVSALLACVGGVVGLYAAWHLNIAPSAAIVLTMVLIFLLAFVFAPQRGWLWTRGKRD